MSKLSFRARALDASKPMPIYLAEELPDLPDYSAINRAVPQMPSGMEKEEESEHHLQRAISGTGLIIPTPEVCEVTDLEFYERCYPPDYKMPKQHIHMQPLWEEQEAPEYDIDSEDERWLKQQRHPDLTELLFEQMMDKLEKCSGQTVVTLNEAKLLLERKDDLVIAVYDYWLNKRLNTQHPLILSVKTESRPGQATNNPYLAFRRRTEKMQTRKNRKNDESSYEKMLKLRRDLARALTLLQLVARREQAKRDLLKLTANLNEKRYVAGDFSNQLLPDPPPRPVYVGVTSGVGVGVTVGGSVFRRELSSHHYPPRHAQTHQDTRQLVVVQREKRPYKRRKHRHHPTTPARDSGVQSSSEEETRGEGAGVEGGSPPDPGPFAFRRKPGCYYEMPTSTLSGDPLDPEQAGDHVTFEHERDERCRYTLTSISHPYDKCIGFARARVGRGGRLLLDRVRTPLDDLWGRLDFTHPHSKHYKQCRDEEVELETKAHRTPRTMCRDYHTSGKHPWRHAFRQHLARHPDLWLADVKPDVKLDVDPVKLDVEIKPDPDDVKIEDTEDFKIDDEKISDVPQDSDISLRTIDDSEVRKCDVYSEIDGAVKENLQQVMRKRSYSGCSDSSYDSDESLYPVEKEFEKFISDVNRKWLHFRPKTPPLLPSPPTPPPPALAGCFAVELQDQSDCFLSSNLSLPLLDKTKTGLEPSPAEGWVGAGEGLFDDLTDNRPFLSHGQGSCGLTGPGSPGGCSSVRVWSAPPPAPAPAPTPASPQQKQPPSSQKQHKQEKSAGGVGGAAPVPVVAESPRPVVKKPPPRRVDATPPPAPPQRNIVEEVNEPKAPQAQIKIEKKKSQDTIEEVVLAHGVQLKTVQTKHSPLLKHIITSGAERRDASEATQQILTVNVEDSLKVRLAGQVVSAAGNVVGVVQNGPFTTAAHSRATIHQPRETVCVVGSVSSGPSVVSVSSASHNCARRTLHPTHTQPGTPTTQLQLGSRGQLVGTGSGVLLAQGHTIHHVAPNKLKVLHAHPLTHTQRNQLLAGNRAITQLPGVVSVATYGQDKPTALLKQGTGPALTQFIEIKGTQLAKGPHLLNVLRQPQPGKTTVARLDLNEAKKRQVVATLDPGTMKGGALPTPVQARAHRLNVSVDARHVLRAQLPAVRAQPIRHQIHLKNRTFQVAAPIARTSTEPSTSITVAAPTKTASIPSSVVANLFQKNVQLPKGGQKIAISGAGAALSANVQAIAFSTQLKARAARLPHRPTSDLAESSGSNVVTTAGPTNNAAAATSEPDDLNTNGTVRRRPPDTLPMEVT